MKDIIGQGAEAILYKEELDGKTVIIKERVKKGYRVTELDDEIRAKRTRHEARLLERAFSNHVRVPHVKRVEKTRIIMEFIDGEKVKDALCKMSPDDIRATASDLGQMTAKIHNLGIIHGDLTTSNFIIQKDTGKIFLIDFGLGKFERKVEAKAVDLHLLYEALKSTHFKVLDKAWGEIVKTYSEEVGDWREIEKRIEIIKKRRRYK